MTVSGPRAVQVTPQSNVCRLCRQAVHGAPRKENTPHLVLWENLHERVCSPRHEEPTTRGKNSAEQRQCQSRILPALRGAWHSGLPPDRRLGRARVRQRAGNTSGPHPLTRRRFLRCEKSPASPSPFPSFAALWKSPSSRFRNPAR